MHHVNLPLKSKSIVVRFNCKSINGVTCMEDACIIDKCYLVPEGMEHNRKKVEFKRFMSQLKHAI